MEQTIVGQLIEKRGQPISRTVPVHLDVALAQMVRIERLFDVLDSGSQLGGRIVVRFVLKVIRIGLLGKYLLE